MTVTKKDVEHIAWLARLELAEEEKQVFARQLGQILEHAGKISNLDTGGIEPTSHVVPLKNVYRKDELRPCLTVEEALSNAPEREGNFFLVPRIL